MAKGKLKTIRIHERFHAYLSNKVGKKGKIYAEVEDLIDADMIKKENKNFYPSSQIFNRT